MNILGENGLFDLYLKPWTWPKILRMVFVFTFPISIPLWFFSIPFFFLLLGLFCIIYGLLYSTWKGELK